MVREHGWRRVCAIAVAVAALGSLLGVGSAVVDGVLTTASPAAADTVDGGLGYTPLASPCRAVDTRAPSVPSGDLAAGEIRDVRIRGAGDLTSQGGSATGCGVPDGATAVELSITAVAPVGAGFIRVFAAASPVPNATFINYTNGRGITNTGTVPLNTSVLNDLGVANFGGTTHLVVDVQGYFSAPGGASYDSLAAPCRVVDTRVAGGTLASGGSRAFQIDGTGLGFAAQGGAPGGCGIPDGAVAYEVSVTVVSPSGSGFLRIAPNDGSNPSSAFVNYTDGTGITNTGAVRPAATTTPGTPDIVVRNFGGQVHVLIDVQGVYGSGSSSGSRYQVLTPCRTVDTRNAGGRLAAGGSRSFQTTGARSGFIAQGTPNVGGCGIPQRAAAVEASITAVAPLGSGFTRPGPTGATPSGTFLNFTAVGGITNTGTLPLPAGGLEDLAILNFGGATDYTVDVLGYFEPLGRNPRSTEVVAAGENHSCSLAGDGQVRCWGRNDSGQLGDGTTIARTTPVVVTGLRDVAQVSVFGASSCAVLVDGTARCWGDNFHGQLGDGTSVDRSNPVVVRDGIPLTGVVQISVGNTHACALLDVGTVRCWGDNRGGQLGAGDLVPSLTIPSVSGLSGVVRIDAGHSHTCAQLANGTARCWGTNTSGQLGDGSVTTRSTPITVTGLTGVVRLSAGADHTCAVLASGGVRCWGANSVGQIGDGTTTARATPVATSGLGDVVQVSAGVNFTCAVQIAGAVRCWGRNAGGLLATGTTTNRLTPAAVVGLGDVTSVSAGAGHICVVSRQGDPSCWGSNANAQLGDGTASDRITPALVSGFAGTVQVSTGFSHSCALDAIGVVRCWGRNLFGQLGNGGSGDATAPVDVADLSGVVEIAVGGDHSCALLFTGTVRCWGANAAGQLGDGTFTPRSSPTPVTGLTGVASISAGAEHTCALLVAGTVKCWGANGTGAVGDGSTTNRTSPAPVTGLGIVVRVTQVSAGGEHTCAVLADTSLECWGSNGNGQLGDGGTTSRSTSGSVIESTLLPLGVTGVREVVAGGFHTCAATTAGTVRCWGRNDFGQVGDGSTTQRPVQVPVSSVTGVVALAAGGAHSCALPNLGVPKCWGYNANGQLGDLSTSNKSAPAGVLDTRFGLPQPLSGVVQIDAGDTHTCSTMSDGGALCWGRNDFGQLGDGTTAQRTTPVNPIGLGS